MSALANDPESKLIERMRKFRHDPEGFVEYAYPWGSGTLKNHAGPRDWQRTVLREIGERLRDGVASRNEVIQEAISSGHGPGKSALVAWLIDWAMSTAADTRGVVTANTESQLKTKTWAELAKWHRMNIASHWFVLTATALFSSMPQHEKTWRMDMVPWSEARTEAFAGLHNEGRRILLVYDEASAIPDSIWEVSEGALTDENTEIIWLACGNPTRNTGRFRECFGRFAHRWTTHKVDTRKVEGVNQAQIDKWIQDYGDDSDFCRVRIKGEFPRAGSNQLIPEDLVTEAMARTLEPRDFARFPIRIGVDVARFGDDRSVIIKRQGPKVWTPKVYRGIDTMELASYVVEVWQDSKRPHEAETPLVLVDGVGLGSGVVDRLKQLNIPVVDVQSAGQALKPLEYVNVRAELWATMRDWLKGGQCDLPEGCNELRDDLTAPEYGFDNKMRMQLEKKDDMKKRGLSSPDAGDSLAMTHAQHTVRTRGVARTVKKPGSWGRAA